MVDIDKTVGLEMSGKRLDVIIDSDADVCSYNEAKVVFYLEDLDIGHNTKIEVISQIDKIDGLVAGKMSKGKYHQDIADTAYLVVELTDKESAIEEINGVLKTIDEVIYFNSNTDVVKEIANGIGE